jgi:hypothetical protein
MREQRTYTLTDKDLIAYRKADYNFTIMIENSTLRELREAKVGMGLSAAKWANRYATPGTDIYDAIYNIYYDYFEKL